MPFSINDYYNYLNPVTYMGIEGNFHRQKLTGSDYKILVCFPDTYALGMSSLGFRLVIDFLKTRGMAFVDICFMPWTDLRDDIDSGRKKIYSHFYKMSPEEFDLVAFSINYEMQITSLIMMLKMFSFYQGDQLIEAEKRPWIMIGGTLAFANPAVFMDFADMIYCGEIEAEMLQVLDVLKKGKNDLKRDVLKEVSDISGLLVPGMFDYDFNDQKGYSFPKRVKRVYVKDLEKSGHQMETWMTPVSKIIQDKVTLEINRGCTQGCRFCLAGMIYRPHRERSSDSVLSAARDYVAQSGYEELSLLSLSAGDYTEINALFEKLFGEFSGSPTSISIPSQRVDRFSEKVAGYISRVRKSGITMAPEAGSERLRKVINKKISDEEIFTSVERAVAYGWNVLKFYFMVGFPTETDEDVLAISSLINKISDICRKTGKNVRINVSVNIFSPKPHTPFQRCSFLNQQEFERKISLIRNNIRSRKIKFDYSEYSISLVETIIARGDFNTGKALREIAFTGRGLDSWKENFNFDLWNYVFDKSGKDCYNMINETYDSDWTFCWELLDVGVTRKFLEEEYSRALKGIEREDCFKSNKCYGCGVC